MTYTDRKELNKHLYRMHGQFVITDKPALSNEELNAVHEDMHDREYCLPPHEHIDGKVELLIPEGYPRSLVDVIRERDSE